MTKKELKKIREKLVEHKRKLLDTIQDNIDKSHQTAENRPSDLMDIASDSYEDEFSMSLAGRDAEELAAINAAIEKIKDGTYGKCSECDKPIKAARLKALPFATLCIKCKEAEEHSQASPFTGAPPPRWE